MDLRCFIALELPDELKKNLEPLIQKLRESDADVRWVPPENLHLTLKFLGNVPEESLPEIRGQVEAAASGHSQFNAALRGMGVFPGPRRPRVVWVGLEDTDVLVPLQKEIDKNLAALGFEPEKRPFSPHLTLGRVKSPRGAKRLLDELEAVKDKNFGEFRAEFVSVMKSKLSPKGATYSRLYSIPLA